MRKWRYILPILGFVIIGGVVFVLFFLMTPTGCGCMPDPSLTLDQKQVEYVIAAEIPLEATEIQFSGYGVDYSEEAGRFSDTEFYVSFTLAPDFVPGFLATLPNLAPMEPNHNPFERISSWVSNFGTTTVFEGSTYQFPLCYRAIMVDKSEPTLYHVYLYARCEGN